MWVLKAESLAEDRPCNLSSLQATRSLKNLVFRRPRPKKTKGKCRVEAGTSLSGR
jgi:hypothetical protein